jgi:hypothetical protein
LQFTSQTLQALLELQSSNSCAPGNGAGGVVLQRYSRAAATASCAAILNLLDHARGIFEFR